MKLTDTAIRNTKPKEKPYKIADGNGLYILVQPTGGKYWRMDYRFLGKRKTLSLGTYPRVKLKVVREKCHDARKLLGEGIDPNQKKKEDRRKQMGISFEEVAREWHQKNKHTWVTEHADKVLGRLEKYIFHWIGAKPIENITPMELLEVLQKIEKQGILDTAHRAKQTCSRVFLYAVATGRAEYDITTSLKGAIPQPKKRNMSTITEPVRVGELLRAIDTYPGYFTTICALKLAPLVFLRPGELRKAEWSEINPKQAEWKIPAEKMKMRDPHIIPLSKQAVKLLGTIEEFTKHRSKYVFPNTRTPTKPMSKMTVTTALRIMGYGIKEMSGHGFRAMASTLLNENGWSSDAVELQLAHKEKNQVRGSYNHALLLNERREMMQWWADYLDDLKGTK